MQADAALLPVINLIDWPKHKELFFFFLFFFFVCGDMQNCRVFNLLQEERKPGSMQAIRQQSKPKARLAAGASYGSIAHCIA